MLGGCVTYAPTVFNYGSYYYITEMAFLALAGLFAEGVAAATEAVGALVAVEEVAGAMEAVAPAAQAAAESG